MSTVFGLATIRGIFEISFLTSDDPLFPPRIFQCFDFNFLSESEKTVCVCDCRDCQAFKSFKFQRLKMASLSTSSACKTT